MFTVLLAFLRIIFAGYFRGGFPIGGVRCCVCMLVIFVVCALIVFVLGG